MTRLVYSSSYILEENANDLDIYLQAAAKIVETVAFEMATQASAASVEEMLELACAIERAAAGLRNKG
jgi:hypothetical protein